MNDHPCHHAAPDETSPSNRGKHHAGRTEDPPQRRRLRARRDRGPVTSAVGVSAVPAAMLGLSSIDAPDYADAFTLPTPWAPTGTAESWARAMFGGTPSIAERFIFQVLLRLELAPVPSRDSVAGFVVAERTCEHIRLEAASTLLICHLVVQVHKSVVSGEGPAGVTRIDHACGLDQHGDRRRRSAPGAPVVSGSS